LKVEYAEETSIRKSLSFEVEAETVEQELAGRARDYARKLRLPGFRAGKVPMPVVRQRMKAQLHEEAAEAIINRVVPPELEGRGLKPVASPKVTELKLDDLAPLVFKIVFEVLPPIELPDWRGLAAKTSKPAVSDEQIDQELLGLRERHARYDPVEGRAIEAGDFAVVDVLWRPAEGGKGGRDENALIEVGGETNPTLREALSGMAIGETKQVSHTPETAENETPQKIDYTLTTKGIKRKLLPEADDDFAKDLGDFESLAELREDIRRRLLANEERRLDRQLKQQLLTAFVQRASFEVPEGLVERHMTALAERAAGALAMQGVDPSKVGIDWREYRNSQRGPAQEAAKAEVLLDELARRENVLVSEAEVEAELQRLARATRKPADRLRAEMQKNGEWHGLFERLREERCLDLLKSSARLEFE